MEPIVTKQEERRRLCLDHAISSRAHLTAEKQVADAKIYEAYLKGQD